MELLSTSARDLDRAADAIRAGLLVAIPTETVYGLGADAWNRVALARVFEAKRRPSFDPLIVHVAEPSGASEVADLSARYAATLAERFWPGPLTMVLPKLERVPDLATSGLPTVAVRCPANAVAREIIRRSGVPVAAPSANPFGYLSPTRAEHVVAQLGDRVDFIVDGGRCPVGVESTVLDLSSDEPLVLRPGGLPVELIAEVIPGVRVYDRATTSPTAPGQLPSHYAPSRPLYLVPHGGVAGIEPRGRAAALCFGAAAAEAAERGGHWSRIVDLSPAMDPVEAAAALFDALHELDAAGFDELWAERLPDDGLGRAVNDRLYKASVK
ncbi:MAG: threonylcarbamoyl-AMP synthase [Spirochaetaceae bacterium]|nr:threonylcarbamoyl-AMP synthase [Spirochaetaceae bacterium]